MYAASSTLERPERLERPSLSIRNSYNTSNNDNNQPQATANTTTTPPPPSQTFQQQPLQQHQQPPQHGTPPPNRRRGSSFGNFTSNLFSNITNSLRNNSSSNLSNNGGTRSRASSASRSNYQSHNNSQTNIIRGNSSGNIPTHAPSNLNHETTNSSSQSNQNDSTFDQSILASTPIEESRLLQGQTRSNSLAQQPNKQDADGTYSIRLTPFIDHSSTSSGLYFSPILRKTKPVTKLSIGRYTDKVREAAQAPPGSDAPVVFKSKVVSRTHAEFLVDNDGNWYIRDLKSSSGTFLNHIRLSPANEESAVTPINNGDVLQLGMDFRGGVEDIFKCVKMRVEMNKSWQRKANQFSKEAHERLRTLALLNESTELSECAICLLKIKPCQAVFISPCSHCWHYKCIRPIVVKSYPQFLCPNCRETCDLEADVDEEDESDEEMSKNDIQEIDSAESSTNANANTNVNVAGLKNVPDSANLTDEDLILEEMSNED